MCHRALQSQPFEELDTIRIDWKLSQLTPFWLSFCFTLTWVTIPSWNFKLYFLILYNYAAKFSWLTIQIPFPFCVLKCQCTWLFLQRTWFFYSLPDWPQVLFLSPSPSFPSACDQICSRHLPTSFLQDAFMIHDTSLQQESRWICIDLSNLWGWESTSASSEVRRERQKPFLLWKVRVRECIALQLKVPLRQMANGLKGSGSIQIINPTI